MNVLRLLILFSTRMREHLDEKGFMLMDTRRDYQFLNAPYAYRRTP